MAVPPRAVSTVVLLGSAQTLAWASSYYLPAMLAGADGRATSASPDADGFLAFSLALLVSAALGPSAGRAIGRWGGPAGARREQPRLRRGLAGSASRRDRRRCSAPGCLSASAMAPGLYEGRVRRAGAPCTARTRAT
jgi:hypothetical protein